MATLDTEEWVNAHLPDGLEACHIPFETDMMDEGAVRRAQQEHFPDLIRQAPDPDSDYALFDGLLYSTRTPTRFDADYPRLVLPPPFQI